MIVCMKMREFVTNFLPLSDSDQVYKDDVYIPVSYALRCDGSLKNVVSGDRICPSIDILSEANIHETYSVSDSLKIIFDWFDNNHGAKTFLSNMIKYDLKHPLKRLVLIFDDAEADNYCLLNFFREYFYRRYGYLCSICIGGGYLMNDRDSTLFYNIYEEPNDKYIKKVVMKQVDEDIEDFKYYRRQIWKKSPKVRISDMSKMRFKELYDEVKYIKPDIGPKGIYTKEELIEILSKRYDSGISLEEIYNSPLYKQMTKAGISISGLGD